MVMDVTRKSITQHPGITMPEYGKSDSFQGQSVIEEPYVST